MKEAYERLKSEYLDTPETSSELTLKFMELERLDRIADALEIIRSDLADCITQNPNGTRSVMAVVSGGVQIY